MEIQAGLQTQIIEFHQCVWGWGQQRDLPWAASLKSQWILWELTDEIMKCPSFHHPAVPAIPCPLKSTLMATETHRHVHSLYKVDTGSPALQKHSDASAAGERMHCGTQLCRHCWLLCHTWLLLWELMSLPWYLEANFVPRWEVGRFEVLAVPIVDYCNWPWVNKNVTVPQY